MSPRLLGIPLLALLLAGCDIPGLEPDPRIAQREADAKAIGGACRYGLRGIEDCYSLNAKSSKSAIFAGWKEMDQYMRDNKVEGQASAIAQAPPQAPQVDAEASIDKDTEKVVAPRKAKAKAAPL
ncbi:hypothetical protein [Xylophilus sp. GOD-11R]|uniref:hypothetical protein n=1 Tax=Xylophilus sp. GOD-11R TaxID=3089814 RepID=UPI00298CDFEA|nr:hypothetical protein [Xylophilus sp. GOD-11R]WPB55240.1 hypothetical protein R9X41_13895 [Xylophilus sp. GOD-11R]